MVERSSRAPTCDWRMENRLNLFGSRQDEVIYGFMDLNMKRTAPPPLLLNRLLCRCICPLPPPVFLANFGLCQWNFVFRTSRATLARLPLYCFCGVRATHKCLAFLQFWREVWPMPLPLMNHSAPALFAKSTRISTSARSIGFCVIWVCISSSSSSSF